MKLVPIYPPEPIFTATCARCMGRVHSPTGFADLDETGSFYCHKCAVKLEAWKVESVDSLKARSR